MPAAWIGAGAAVLGAVGGSGGGGASQVAQGIGNVAGGALSGQEAQQFGNQLAQTANPFGQYNQQFSQQMAALGAVNAQGQGTFGQGAGAAQILPSQAFAGNSSNTNYLGGLQNYTNQSQGLTGALNGQQYGQQINQLVADPSSVFDTAQYKAAFGQGQSAVNSTLAAQGLNASGNQLAALQGYGQTFGQNAYNTQLSQLSGLYGQALGANQQGYAQQQGTAQMGLAQNQQQYSQLSNAASLGLQQNNMAFGQLSQMSGLATGSPTAAAAAQAQVYGNVNSAYGSVGQGLGQIVGGAGNILNGLNFGGSPSTTTGNNSFGFNSGLGNTTNPGDISGSGALFGTSAGTNTGGFNFSGPGNTFGFTE